MAMEKQLTLEEFLRLPTEKPALEYIDGVIRQKVSPQAIHAILQLELADRINASARRSRIALAMPEVRATFGGESHVPDVSVYRWERIPRNDRGEPVGDFHIPPDIAIEIVSPGQRVNSLIRLCGWYVANGVEIALLVDPADRSVTAMFPGGDIEKWHGQARMGLDPVVPGFELSVEQLFTSLTE